MNPDPHARAARRSAARRLGRNVVAMTEASEREFAQGEAAVAGFLARAVVVALLGAVWAVAESGWPAWAQGLAVCGLAGLAVVGRAAWRAQLPEPPPAPEAPPMVRVTPRPRQRRAGPPTPPPNVALQATRSAGLAAAPPHGSSQAGAGSPAAPRA